MDKYKEKFNDAILEITNNLRANNPDFQHVSSKFAELIDGVNKELKTEDGVFVTMPDQRGSYEI